VHELYTKAKAAVTLDFPISARPVTSLPSSHSLDDRELLSGTCAEVSLQGIH